MKKSGTTIETTMDIDTVLQKARHHISKLSKKSDYMKELSAFEDFIARGEWGIEAIKNAQIQRDFLQQQNSKQATFILDRLNHIMNPSAVPSLPLTTKQKFNKLAHFTEHVSFCSPTFAEACVTVEQYIPDEYSFLRHLEAISLSNKVPLSEYLVTAYHQSGLPMNEYIAQNSLLTQLQSSSKVSPMNRNVCVAAESMMNYLIEYEYAMYKPLPSSRDCELNIARYADDIDVIQNYMVEINNGIRTVLSDKSATVGWPVQIDVFFVAPGSHTDLNFSELLSFEGCLMSDPVSRQAIDGVAAAYRLLREAAARVNDPYSNGQRFVMLIVRANESNSCDDALYLFSQMNAIPDGDVISDTVELTYLLNSKCGCIVDGLSSCDEGVLGFTHHLHSRSVSKVYLSYGEYKSRVFAEDLLSKLVAIMDKSVAAASSSLKNGYCDFVDSTHETGLYWLNNAASYECYEPYWNPQNCRAMGNVFIPKQCTTDLAQYIDESFCSAEKLYYKMDYTIGMQIVDGETVYIGGRCLVHTQLHRNGHALYAVIVRNTHKSKQRWKMIDYDEIGEAFMTQSELRHKYGVFEFDLPVGSCKKHGGFEALRDEIRVRRDLIHNTNWGHVRIVQSKQNLGVSKTDESLHMTARSFKRCVLAAFESANESDLIPIAHFKFRKNKYHLEKLLPVYLPQHDKYVAISFWFNQMAQNEGRTQASGVCLDLTDLKNKANLIQMVPQDSWLNRLCKNGNTCNNLVIETKKKKKKKQTPMRKKKTKRKKKKKKTQPTYLAQPQPPPQVTYHMKIEQCIQTHRQYAQSLPNPSNFHFYHYQY